MLGKKLGTTQIFNNEGKVVPATLVSVQPCCVVSLRMPEKDGYTAIQIGCGERKKIKKSVAGQLKKAGIEKNLAVIKEFRVDSFKLNGKELKPGDIIDVSIFQEGDKVKISGLSKGKGFQGPVKRWGFSGRNATHGVKHEERTHGSVGSTTPSKVIKGRKMAGHMGSKRVTIRGLKVIKVDKENNVLAIEGSVPGPKGNLLEIRSE